MSARLPIALLGLCLAACAAQTPVRATEPAVPEAPAAGLVEADGTIRHIPLEGGFWGIVADDGRRFDPLELDPALQRDGLRVHFQALPETDVMTTRMWGTPVTLRSIEVLSGGQR